MHSFVMYRFTHLVVSLQSSQQLVPCMRQDIMNGKYYSPTEHIENSSKLAARMSRKLLMSKRVSKHSRVTTGMFL